MPAVLSKMMPLVGSGSNLPRGYSQKEPEKAAPILPTQSGRRKVIHSNKKTESITKGTDKGSMPEKATSQRKCESSTSKPVAFMTILTILTSLASPTIASRPDDNTPSTGLNRRNITAIDTPLNPFLPTSPGYFQAPHHGSTEQRQNVQNVQNQLTLLTSEISQNLARLKAHLKTLNKLEQQFVAYDTAQSQTDQSQPASLKFIIDIQQSLDKLTTLPNTLHELEQQFSAFRSTQDESSTPHRRLRRDGNTNVYCNQEIEQAFSQITVLQQSLNSTNRDLIRINGEKNFCEGKVEGGFQVQITTADKRTTHQFCKNEVASNTTAAALISAPITAQLESCQQQSQQQQEHCQQQQESLQHLQQNQTSLLLQNQALSLNQTHLQKLQELCNQEQETTLTLVAQFEQFQTQLQEQFQQQEQKQKQEQEQTQSMGFGFGFGFGGLGVAAGIAMAGVRIYKKGDKNGYNRAMKEMNMHDSTGERAERRGLFERLKMSTRKNSQPPSSGPAKV